MKGVMDQYCDEGEAILEAVQEPLPWSQEAQMWHGVAIDRPNYADPGKLFGLPGQKVVRPVEWLGAIRNAVRQVECGKTVILNVVLSC